MSEWKTNTSLKPGIVISSCEGDSGGFGRVLSLHWPGRVVRQLHPRAGPCPPGGGTASGRSPSHTWTWRDLRGVGVDLRAPGAAVVRRASAIAGLCFQSAGSWAAGKQNIFHVSCGWGLISLQKPSQTSIIEQKTAKPAGEKQILCVRFVAIPLLFLISLQSCFFYLTTRGLFKNCWHNADDRFWSMTPLRKCCISALIYISRSQRLQRLMGNMICSAFCINTELWPAELLQRIHQKLSLLQQRTRAISIFYTISSHGEEASSDGF